MDLPEDIDVGALLGDDPSPEELAAARARAMRGKQDYDIAPPDARTQALGSMLQMGGPTLAPLGQGLVQQAHQQQQISTQSADRRFAKALEAQRAAATQTYQRAQLARESAHDKANERIEQQRADADKGRPIVTAGGLFDKDPKTGAIRRLTDPEGNPLMAPPRAGAAAGDTKRWKAYGEAISTYRGRSNLSKDLQGTVNKAEALEALVLGPGGQIQNLNPAQVREAATALAQLIARGVVSVSQLEDLTPHTLAGKFASAKQYVFNSPQGADAQAFLQNMLDTAAREKGLALKQIRRNQLQGLPEHIGLRAENPQKFDDMAQAAGLDPKSFDERGRDITEMQMVPHAPAAQLRPGYVRMRDPQGKLHGVPQAQVQEAAARKWKAVE